MKKTYKIVYKRNLVIIENISLKSIHELPKEEVEDLYNKHGAILFRNFNINVNELKDYTDLYSLTYANDASRRIKISNSRYIKSVDEGNKMMPLHSEASYSSSWPDIIWFYCVKPPLKSGYTTLCDGKSVYENFKLETKKFFYIEKNISNENYEKIMKLGDKSIQSEEKLIRIYPEKNLFSHIIGQIDNDNNGISGLEKSLDEDLKSVSKPVELTVDKDIQFLVRKELLKFNTCFIA